MLCSGPRAYHLKITLAGRTQVVAGIKWINLCSRCLGSCLEWQQVWYVVAIVICTFGLHLSC
jgi:hypothetical protein